MSQQPCGCGHVCRYVAENELESDPPFERLRDWCCICDGREPCSMCVSRDTPEARQERGQRFEEATEIVRPILEPILAEYETAAQQQEQLNPTIAVLAALRRDPHVLTNSRVLARGLLIMYGKNRYEVLRQAAWSLYLENKSPSDWFSDLDIALAEEARSRRLYAASDEDTT